MAVDESLYRATETLILPSPRKFYRATVHAHHWQLRSLISSPHDNCVYYPSGSAIYRLNMRTCRRELVTTIKFSPRCLSAAEGWICCGGEEGQFAIIRLVEDKTPTNGRHVTLAAAADARLPLNLDASRSVDSVGGSLPSHQGTPEGSFVRTTKIGEEIVNCITFWFPPSNSSTDLYSAPVAVLANNDHNVTIVDLQSSDALQTITFEDCINRAVISPDGRLLIAIGDDPFMYVYSRDSFVPRDQFSILHKTKYRWKQASKIQLVGQYHSDKGDTRGSFAASFSKSGKFLAIGTQYGIISIFDTARLEEPEVDPLKTAFTTSRPNSRRGAVRDLEFSPEPYDLLTWTEHTGRVGVADARDNFVSRQIIALDSRAEGVTRVALTDRDEVALIPFEGRYRSVAELLTEADSGRSDSPDLLTDELQHRRLREELTNDMLERLQPHAPSDETASAFQVLQALQEQRRARESMREAGGNAPSATMSGARATSVALNRYRDQFAERTTSPSSTLPSILREFTSGERSNASLRAYISERNQDRLRRGQEPRRRGSIILDAAGRALDRESRDLRTARTSQSEANSQDGLTRLPPRLPAIGSDLSSNPWTEIEALYNVAVDPPVDLSARLRVETEDERSDHTRRWGRNFEQGRAAYIRGSGFLTNAPPPVDLDETCGCCWSRDGRILFVCTEDGIFEYHVNTNGRKFFPSLRFR